MKTKRTHLLAVIGLLGLALLNAQVLAAGRASALSRWLSLEAAPELQQQLGKHPRYSRQQVRIVAQSGDALAAAVVRVLRTALPELVPGEQRQLDAGRLMAGAVHSIDSLPCQAVAADYRLEVIVAAAGKSASVELAMVAVHSGAIVERWRWRGELTAAERKYSQRSHAPKSPRGDLAAPWGSKDVAAAASVLSRELVCNLRPYTVGITALHWPEDPGLPAGTLADTVSASRHFVGAYRELDITGASGYSDRDSWRVEVHSRRFDSGVWQLWLMAIPADSLHPGVQAVTYIAGSGMAAPVAQLTRQSTRHPGPDNAGGVATGSGQAGDPASYLAVELLGATRAERAGSADLRLRLRLHNLAERPLAYRLQASGGYFAHCLGTPEHYRHQLWGQLAGKLQPGETRVEQLRIPNLLHGPAAVAGGTVCAGFGDLRGFQDYRRRGGPITDYVRWEL